jgi:hypothetical protein
MRKKRNKSQHCLNCGYNFSIEAEHNNYCPNCGQENHDPRQPIRHLLYEFLEALFHFDNRSLNTLRLVLFNPGVVTRNHLHGIRKRYTPPNKLFIFSLAVFIVFLEAAQDTMVSKDAPAMEKLSLKQQMNLLPDTTHIAFSKPFFTGSKIYFTVAQLKDLEHTQPGELRAWLKSSGKKSWLVYKLEARMVKHNIESDLSVRDFNRHIVRIHYEVILLMMPISAFLIYLFFFGRGKMYYDALIVSVHLYVFALITGIVITMIVLALISSQILRDTTIVLPIVMLLSVTCNFIPSYKKVYGLNWLQTIVRGSLIGFFNISIQVLLFWIIAGYGG